MRSGDMIELFMFIHPLDMASYVSSQMLIDFATERSEKITIRFITYPVNHSIYSRTCCLLLKGSSGDVRQIVNPDFIASLAFQAATMQGKKKGYDFLLLLQTYLFKHGYTLSEALMWEVASQVGLDVSIFQDDVYSPLAKKAYARDYQLAKQMNISQSPTCILNHCTQCCQSIRLCEPIDKYTLHRLCNHDLAHYHSYIPYKHNDLFQIL